MVTPNVRLEQSEVAKRVGAAVLLLYLAACFTPVVGLDESSPNGLFLLWFGLMGGFGITWAVIPWSANAFLGLGMVELFRKHYRQALLLGILGNILGLTTWWFLWDYPLLIGYYLWQASMVVLVVGVIRCLNMDAVAPSGTVRDN